MASPSSSAGDFFPGSRTVSPWPALSASPHQASISFGSFTDPVGGSPASFWDPTEWDFEDDHPSASLASALVALPEATLLGGLNVQPLSVSGPLDDALCEEPCFPFCASDGTTEAEPEWLRSYKAIGSVLGTLDVVVSLAKVADVDKSLGNDSLATDGFQEATKLLESLKFGADEAVLEQRRQSVLNFLKNQNSDE